MKACEDCQRVSIGARYDDVSSARVFFGLVFIYRPIVFFPFALLAALSVYIHLRLMGAVNVKPLGAFLPDRKSHRYRHKTQIIRQDANRAAIDYSYWHNSRDAEKLHPDDRNNPIWNQDAPAPADKDGETGRGADA